jgi:hypothetical protein
MSTLTEHVAHLRTLAALDPGTTVLQQAMVNVLVELAQAVQDLADEEPQGLKGG